VSGRTCMGEDKKRAEEGVERCVSRGGGRGGRVKKSREQCSDMVEMLDMSSNILIKSKKITDIFHFLHACSCIASLYYFFALHHVL
jgi:hypothetical protein